MIVMIQPAVLAVSVCPEKRSRFRSEFNKFRHRIEADSYYEHLQLFFETRLILRWANCVIHAVKNMKETVDIAVV